MEFNWNALEKDVGLQIYDWQKEGYTLEMAILNLHGRLKSIEDNIEIMQQAIVMLHNKVSGLGRIG